MTEEFALQFAADWAASWNSHNLEKILAHYADDFSIETPMALKLVPQSQGRLQGKENVKAYWSIGLQRIPDLYFEVLDVLSGIDSIAVYYINKATGKKSVENMFFNAGNKVEKVVVMYS